MGLQLRETLTHEGVTVQGLGLVVLTALRHKSWEGTITGKEEPEPQCHPW